MNSDQTIITEKGKSEKINVPVKGQLAKRFKENRGKAGLAAGMLAATVFVSAKNIEPLAKTKDSQAEINPVSEEEMVENDGVYVSIDPGDSILQSADNLEFSDAFHHAREELGPGGIFEWNNDYYNTFFKEEWESMTEEEKSDYSEVVNNSINENSSYVVESNQGNLVTAEFSSDNLMTIALENPVVAESLKGIELDLANDGEMDLSINIETLTKAPSTLEEISDEKDFVVDAREEDKEELDRLEADSDLDTNDGFLTVEAEETLIEDSEQNSTTLEFDDLPNKKMKEEETEEGTTDQENYYPDTDDLNEELLQ